MGNAPHERTSPAAATACGAQRHNSNPRQKHRVTEGIAASVAEERHQAAKPTTLAGRDVVTPIRDHPPRQPVTTSVFGGDGSLAGKAASGHKSLSAAILVPPRQAGNGQTVFRTVFIPVFMQRQTFRRQPTPRDRSPLPNLRFPSRQSLKMDRRPAPAGILWTLALAVA